MLDMFFTICVESEQALLKLLEVYFQIIFGYRKSVEVFWPLQGHFFLNISTRYFIN